MRPNAVHFHVRRDASSPDAPGRISKAVRRHRGDRTASDQPRGARRRLTKFVHSANPRYEIKVGISLNFALRNSDHHPKKGSVLICGKRA